MTDVQFKKERTLLLTITVVLIHNNFGILLSQFYTISVRECTRISFCGQLFLSRKPSARLMRFTNPTASNFLQTVEVICCLIRVELASLSLAIKLFCAASVNFAFYNTILEFFSIKNSMKFKKIGKFRSHKKALHNKTNKL